MNEFDAHAALFDSDAFQSYWFGNHDVCTDGKYSSVAIIDGSKAFQVVGSQIGLIGEPTSQDSHIDVDIDVSIGTEQGAVEVSFVDPTQLFSGKE